MSEKKEKQAPQEDLKSLISDAVKQATQSLVSQIDKQQKDIGMLLQTADKREVAKYYARNRKEMPSEVKLRAVDVVTVEKDKDGNPKKDEEGKTITKLEKKLIVGWHMVEDRGSYQIPGTGKWTEYQLLELIFSDGTTTKMTEMEFERKYEKVVKAKVLKVITDSDSGEEAVQVQRNDTGEELTIGVRFIN